jgi:hypothetical protein
MEGKTMRKAAICFLLLLCSAIAFGQQQPQWTVVQSEVLSNQNQPIAQTLLTPTEASIYRLTIYFSVVSGPSPQGAFELTVVGKDISGLPLTGTPFGFGCGGPGFFQVSSAISLKPNLPLSFEVKSFGIPSQGCVYNLAITVEQLVQQ